MQTITVLTIVFVVFPFLIFVLMISVGFFFGDTLKNDPNRLMPDEFDRRNTGKDGKLRSDLPYKPDPFGIFTDLADEKAKTIVAGETFKECIMHYPGHTFRGMTKRSNLEPKDPDYWDVVTTPPGEKDCPAIGRWPLFSWKSLLLTYRLAWWGWQKILFDQRGLVFVGFWPWRKIRIYRLEYFVSIHNEEGVFGVERRVSYSDHIRVGPFQFYVPIGSSETTDLLPIKQVVSQLMWSNNPYKSAYKTDDNWGSFMFARLSTEITNVVNRLGIHDALTNNEEDNKNFLKLAWLELSKLVEENGPINKIGFHYEADGLTIPDRSSTNKETGEALGAEALAKVNANAKVAEAKGYADSRRIKAEADADAVKANAKAIDESGIAGVQIAQIEGAVRQVEAAPQGAVIIVGGQQSIDPATLALLAQNQKDKKE